MISEPFPHIVIDDFVPAELCRAAVAEWPDQRWPYWFHYAGTERGAKSVSRDPDRLTPACKELTRWMASLRLETVLGIKDAFPDLSLYGAGMSEILPGGYLPLHRDSNNNPNTGWERAASAMLYLTECAGGDLQLWNADGTEVEKDIPPRPGRLVVFECTETAWHSVAEVIDGARRRLSLSLFFWRIHSGPGPRGNRSRAEFQRGTPS